MGNVTTGPPWDNVASIQTHLIPWGFKSLPADWVAWEGLVWLGACGCGGGQSLGRELSVLDRAFKFPQTGKLRLGKTALPADSA